MTIIEHNIYYGVDYLSKCLKKDLLDKLSLTLDINLNIFDFELIHFKHEYDIL